MDISDVMSMETSWLFTLLSHQSQSHPQKKTFAELFRSYTATDCIEYLYTQCRHHALAELNK